MHINSWRCLSLKRCRLWNIVWLRNQAAFVMKLTCISSFFVLYFLWYAYILACRSLSRRWLQRFLFCWLGTGKSWEYLYTVIRSVRYEWFPPLPFLIPVKKCCVPPHGKYSYVVEFLMEIFSLNVGQKLVLRNNFAFALRNIWCEHLTAGRLTSI